MSGDEFSPPLHRRTVLKTIGGSIAASTTIGTATSESDYDDVVDIVEAGADNTGSEPIDDVFSAHASDDTLIEFPAGRYRVNDLTIYGLSNFAMVGTGDAVLVPGEEYEPRTWIAGTNNRNVRIENFTIDNTADGVGSTVDVDAYDGLVVRNVTKIGHHDVNLPSFGFRIIEEDGEGLVENLELPDGGESVGIYTDPAGTITYRECHVEGFADNGIYGSIGTGPVHVEGGTYRNNNVTSIRLSAPGSSVTGATVVVEDPPEAFGNCRGIRISDGPGPVHIADCEIRMVSGHGTGGIVGEGSGGSFTVQDSAIRVDEEYTVGSTGERTGYAVYVDPATDELGSRTIENTVINGGGTELAAVRIGRDDNTIRNVCLEQTGTDRSGIIFLGCHDNVVTDTSISVPGEEIRLDGGSTVERQNVSTDGTCDGSVSDDGDHDGRILTVVGQGTTAHYEFTVDGPVEKSTAYDGTINDFDEVHDDGTVTGRTTNEPDSFAVSGEITDFEADAPVDVSIDGEAVDPDSLGSDVLTIVGDGTTAYYEFVVNGDVSKSTAHDGTINSFDEIDGDTVTGRTTNEPDSFAYTGEITDFQVDGSVTVLHNGEEIDPKTLGRRVITVVGKGSTAHYEFTVDGDVAKSELYGGTINDFDEVHDDGTVTGRTTEEPDSFAFSGEITDFEADAPVDVSIDGEAVEPTLLGTDVLTITGEGSLAYYEFTVDGDVAKSEQYGGTINDFDEIHDDDTVTGRTTNEPDSFEINGVVRDFEIDGSAEVLADGDEIDID